MQVILESKSRTPWWTRFGYWLQFPAISYPPEGYEILAEEIGTRTEYRWREKATGALGPVDEFPLSTVQNAWEHSKRNRWEQNRTQYADAMLTERAKGGSK